MEIETLAVERLVPYARNARLHSDMQVAQIAASIREFGFCNPILIDKDDGIIAGHGRVLAARKLDMTDISCVRLGHLTDTQRRAYILADNQLALSSEWDAAMLALELAALQADGQDLEMLGFESVELYELLDGEDPPPEGANPSAEGKTPENQETAGPLCCPRCGAVVRELAGADEDAD